MDHKTITRRTGHGWLALRMCDDQELCRATGRTFDQARARLVIKIAEMEAEKKLKEK